MSCSSLLDRGGAAIGIDLGNPGSKTKENALFDPPLDQDRRVLPWARSFFPPDRQYPANVACRSELRKSPSSPPVPPAQESAFGILVATSHRFAKISATGSPPPPPGGPGLVHGNLLKKGGPPGQGSPPRACHMLTENSKDHVLPNSSHTL